MFGWAGRRKRNQPDRLKKLAERVDALADKDVGLIEEAARIEKLRIAAAVELHALCAAFVRDVNRLVTKTELTFDPAEFTPEQFKDGTPNLFQINVRGRILQIEFEVTDNPTSTENFREPYVLQGAVRGFNQDLLEHDAIEEELLFYVDGEKGGWRVFDARTYRISSLDESYLTSLMQRLV